MWGPAIGIGVGILATCLAKILYSWLKNPKVDDKIEPPTIPPAAVR